MNEFKCTIPSRDGTVDIEVRCDEDCSTVDIRQGPDYIMVSVYMVQSLIDALKSCIAKGEK